MVLNVAEPTTSLLVGNKENTILKHARLKQSTGRRHRSRPNNSPPLVFLARKVVRDPGRRGIQSSPIYTPTQSISQVADIAMAGATIPTQDSAPQRHTRLPRHLKRPAFGVIAPAAIEAVHPELKEVPIEYIHQILLAAGLQLLCAVAHTTVDPPRTRLPRELEVVINDVSADAPTHLFAVYSKPASRVTVYPAHAIILASYCTHLPPLPYSKPSTPSETGRLLTLPVVPLCLPSPAIFPDLLHYLYTKREDHLLASLLPMAPQEASESTERLSRTLAATLTQQALLTQVAKVHGLWSNAVALGVFDEKLWRMITMVWEVMLDALAISGASWTKWSKGVRI